MADPTIWLPMIYYPQEERERILNIIDIAGDYIAGNTFGRDYIEGDQTNINNAGEGVININKDNLNDIDFQFKNSIVNLKIY